MSQAPRNGPVSAQGVLFDGRSSRAHDATLTLEGAELVVRSAEAQWRVAARDVVLEAPIGTLRRTVKLPQGARFDTDDLAAVSALEAALKRNRGLRLVNALEDRWPAVLGLLVALALSAFAFQRWGLPVAARTAALLTPRTVLAALDRQTLALLDKRLLRPTQLPAARQARLRAEFARIPRATDPSFPYTVAFRSGASLGANAFALPNGTVVVTDDLVRLAQSDREVLGVLAHEVGHVTKRHGVRSIYQSVGIVLFASLLTGDVAASSTVAGAFSVALVQNGYSRDMEREADEVAAHFLMREYGSTRALRDILQRLDQERGSLDVPDLLSTHPGTPERLANLRRLERAGTP